MYPLPHWMLNVFCAGGRHELTDLVPPVKHQDECCCSKKKYLCFINFERYGSSEWSVFKSQEGNLLVIHCTMGRMSYS